MVTGWVSGSPRRAEAWKVLQGKRDSLTGNAARERACAFSDLVLRGAKRARVKKRADGPLDVGDGREVDVHPHCFQRASRRPSARARLPDVIWLGASAGGAHVSRLIFAPLLVGHDQQRGVAALHGRLLERCNQFASGLLSGLDVARKENDSAYRPGPDTAQQGIRGR